VLATLTIAGGLAWRHYEFVLHNPLWRPLIATWILGSIMFVAQWVMSLFDRPATVTIKQEWALDKLRLVVNMPVFNEDPRILDQALYAVVNQSRAPDRVDVIDDFSSVDYTQLIQHWVGWHRDKRTEVTWRRQATNGGKKEAQVRTFLDDPDADIFCTVDSDSCPAAWNCFEEGMKPFKDPRVQSVAGIVLVHNVNVNWITRTTDARTLGFQIVTCGAQSVVGGVLVNRGPIAFYRAEICRDLVPQYIDETFLGQRIRLGDDAALTLFARGRGRTVQQSSCFSFSAYPETMKHHLKQWMRWMRGSTIRNTWRIRYLPFWSYDWWFTFLGLFMFFVATAIPISIAINLPQSKTYALWYLVSTSLWSYITGLRILAVRRSDQRGWKRLTSYVTYPFANLWTLLVLRWCRYYGMLTYWKQGWNTRQDGAEELTAPKEEALA
jgi:hyaluronan synthase